MTFLKLMIKVHNEAANPKDCLFMIIFSWVSESETGLSATTIAADIKKKADTFGEPFRTILKSIPSETEFWHNRLSSWPTRPWDNRNGTVTLAGDAAHPMTFRKSFPIRSYCFIFHFSYKC
jgi:hypothetical protein